MIEAKIIADSVAPSNVRLTTFVLTYPRFIHSEFMTHRVFSRNASSSRAIPFTKQIEMIKESMAKPLSYLANQRGMQGGDELSEDKQEIANEVWERAAAEAIKAAEQLNNLGVHKQYVNRLIEPFSHITVVCTANDYDNFFGLRYHYMAQPEICQLAKLMYEAYIMSRPTILEEGEWHLPFVSETEKEMESIEPRTGVPALLRKSVARCARVSYNNHDGTCTTLEQDTNLYNRLLGAQPIHASPAEHQAMAVGDKNVRSGNLRGWIQYRKTLEGENIEKFEPGKL